MPRSVAGVVIACLAAFALPAVALAHADLVESDPPDGGILTTTPYTLTATFSEEVDAAQSSIVVEDSAGAEIGRGAVSATEPKQMLVDLPRLEPGHYVVRWTTVTTDDQGVERGTYSFEVAGSATPSPSAPPGGNSAGSGSDVLIALLLAAVGIGAVVAFIFVRGRR